MKRYTIWGVYFLAAVVVLIVLPVCSFSQPDQSSHITTNQYVVERAFTTENGLPGNGVNMIYQDSSGYIWAATYNGLVRFNGSGFKVYNTSTLNNLRSNRFTSVTEDREGRIWAGLEYSNFVVIDEERDTTITYLIDQDRIGSTTRVSAITFDSNNTPWIGSDNGLVKVQNNEIEYFDHLPKQQVNHIRSRENYMYVLYAEKLLRLNVDGSINKIIAELRDNVIYFENSQIDDFENVVQFMDFHFIDGVLYLISEAGLIRYDDSEARIIFSRDDVQQAALHGFLPHEDLLYVYGRDGIFSTDLIDQTYTYYTRVNVIDILFDHEESLWAATSSNGIRQYISTPIYQGEKFSVLDEQGTTGVLQSESGSIFVGTNCNGIYEFKGDEVLRFGEDQGFENECVWSLMEEENGNLWAGTWSGGVYYRAPNTSRFQRFKPEIFDEVSVFLSIFKDSDDNIWFGTYYNGLYRYDGNQTIPILDENGEPLAAVRKIYKSRNEEDIYVATDEGIGVLSDGEIDIFEEFNSLETSNFRTIAEDSDGRFWFGSYGGGLIVYEPGEEPVTITTENGLFDNTISQLHFDDRGGLWLGGNLGVFYLEKNEIDSFLNGETDQLRVSRLGVEEGMSIRETNGGFMPSSQLTTDGKLLIPTVQGVNAIDTNRMELNRIPPNVFVEEVEIDGETFKSSEIKSISYSAQRLVFNFSGLSFENPKNNQYEYMLEGFDKNWIQAGNTHEAIYSSIPAGEYTLKVRASNNDGFWNTNEASFSFRVIPPFWQTTWFYLLVFMLIGALIIGGFRYRVRNIRKNNRQLQRMVAERTEELSVSNKELKKHIEDKNKLQSILAHDLRNPFTAILGYIELIKNEFEQKGDKEHVEMMNMLLDSGRNTLSLLENLLQWSGSKEGGLEANFEAVDVTQLVEEAISMTEAQSTFKNIFVRNLIEESYFVWADRNMILSVIRNLLSNAIKFSGRDSIVEISLKEQEEKVIISVEDPGVGIPEGQVNKLFSSDSKTHQKVGTQGEKGIGMGLLLCKEFIQKHDEEIWVSSTPKKGSTFSFSLSKVTEPAEQQIDIDETED